MVVEKGGHLQGVRVLSWSCPSSATYLKHSTLWTLREGGESLSQCGLALGVSLSKRAVRIRLADLHEQA